MSETDPESDAAVQYTTDPALVRSVVEERGGYPAHEPQSEGQGDEGLLRIGFRDRDEDLREISWEEFQEEFEAKDLAFGYREDGGDVGDRPVVLRKRENVEAVEE